MRALSAADCAQRGAALYKRGCYKDAIHCFDNALERASTGASERASILGNRYARDTRVLARLRLNASDRPSAKAHWRLARALYALRRFSEAADECAAAAGSMDCGAALKATYERGREEALCSERGATAARDLREAGNALFPTSPLDAAERYRAALAEDAGSGDVAARANLAAALLALGRHADGPSSPGRVAPEQRPVAAKLFVRAGCALRALGLHADAAASFRLALDFAPGQADARDGLEAAERAAEAEPPPAPLDGNRARVPRLATGGALLARPVYYDNHYLQYPFGNTEARAAASRAELEAAHAASGAPVSLLFLGVGDVRNVLRTAEEAGPAGPPLAFHLCDIDRCVLARRAPLPAVLRLRSESAPAPRARRDALLLVAASRMAGPAAEEDALFLWRLWFCLDMRPGQRRRLGALLAELAGAAASPEAWAASPHGAWLRVPCPGDLALLREVPPPPPRARLRRPSGAAQVWEYWLSEGLPTLAQARVQRHSHDLRVTARLASRSAGPGAGAPRPELRTNDAAIGGRESEAARIADIVGGHFGDAPREMADWFRALSASPDDAAASAAVGSDAPVLNPTLVTPPGGLCLVHYALHPFRAFSPAELAACSDAAAPGGLFQPPAGAPADSLAEPPPRALCRAAARRLAALAALFSASVASGRVSASFYPADGLQLCWEGASGGGAGALPAGERFDFIDGSNLADNEGLWPVLTACGWRLREGPHAALATTTMKWIGEHSDPGAYIRAELGFGPELAPTLLGLRLATDLEALRLLAPPPPRGRMHFSNTALEVSLRWKAPATGAGRAAAPTRLALREGGALHAALAALADRSILPAPLFLVRPPRSLTPPARALTPRRRAGLGQGGGPCAPTHATAYLLAVAARDLAGRAADGPAALRLADPLVAARAEGGSGPIRSSLAAQWRAARALAGVDIGGEAAGGAGAELVYVRAEGLPPFSPSGPPPSTRRAPPCGSS
eukprot:tig00020911_g15710.t1